MPARKTLKETDLYPPLHDYLVAQGYAVRSEVNDCDVTATKGEDLVVIEIKRSLNLTLLSQAAQRQRITDSVYVAVPMPDEGVYSKKWRSYTHLLKRLELGLVLITLGSQRSSVQVAFHPVPFQRRKSRANRRALLEEIAGRTGDYNTGGSVQRKLVTAYREQAIHVACALHRLGPSTPKILRGLGTSQKTTSILYGNVYGWFERVDRGLYRLAAQGKDALKDYPDLVEHYDGLLAGETPGV